MNWLEILKKEDKEFEVSKKKDIESNDEIIIEEEDLFLKKTDDEFEKEYMNKILDIKDELIEYIQHNALPFLNKTDQTTTAFNFYEFIKNNCLNYLEVEKSVNKENEEYLEDLKKEEEEAYEEFKMYYDLDE